IQVIKTQGDLVQDLSFDKMEGKGFFTKELEVALLQGNIDLAVHSHKDLETDQPKGLRIAAVTAREEPNDLLLIDKNAVDTKRRLALKEGAVVGTSSARRKSFLTAFRKDVVLKDLRGNVPTRICDCATRARTAPASECWRKTSSPVVTAPNVRVVGTPKAYIASDRIYSRNTGPMPALPSPPREYFVRPDPFRCKSNRAPSGVMTSPNNTARPSPNCGDQPPN
ncbi:MAG: hypothetical protein COB84_04685, partial [Rhodobacteraceae bacterium]